MSANAEETPYNTNNKVLTEEHLRHLLTSYGVTDPPNNVNLYRSAMVHRSYCTRKNENIANGNSLCPPGCIPLQEISNERLEYLGDSVLSLVVASHVYERYTRENEGFLTKVRTKLVNGTMLASLAKELGLGEWVVISKQIDDNHGRSNKNVLEDCLEAFIGALYLDFNSNDHEDDLSFSVHGKGLQHAYTWITGVIEAHVDFCELLHDRNYKDMYFKYSQNNFKHIPVIEEVQHSNTSDSECTVCIKDSAGHVVATGTGPNRKQAELDACKTALMLHGQV